MISDMSALEYKLTIQRDYLLVERPHDYEVVISEQSERLREISAACKDADCRKVLIIGPKTTVKLSVTELFNLGHEIARLGLQIAVVELHDASNADVKFLENVVQNRGNPIQFFDNTQDAKEWLGVS